MIRAREWKDILGHSSWVAAALKVETLREITAPTYLDSEAMLLKTSLDCSSYRLRGRVGTGLATTETGLRRASAVEQQRAVRRRREHGSKAMAPVGWTGSSRDSSSRCRSRSRRICGSGRWTHGDGSRMHDAGTAPHSEAGGDEADERMEGGERATMSN